ncbi:MAG: hypothetical protein ACKVQJ_09940 [Pyrinomonadaceae bacterium]
MKIDRLAKATLFLIPLILSACGGPPSASDGRKLIEDKIQAGSGKFLKLISFDKTNGIDRSNGGTKLYELDYTAEIEFLDNCNWNSVTFAAGPYRAPDPNVIMDLPEPNWNVAKKGTRTKLTGKLMYEMTEKGWRLTK